MDKAQIIAEGKRIIAALENGDMRDHGPHALACDFLQRHAGEGSSLFIQTLAQAQNAPQSKNRSALTVLSAFLGEFEQGNYPLAEEHSTRPYVNPRRLHELRTLNSQSFDFSRLVRLCEELNTCYSTECNHAVAMLVRSIIDHVPPIFGKHTFTEIVNNYSSNKSFRELIGQLESSLRKIADAHLHTQIRERETLPNVTQIDFSNALDVLLGEIVRISKA